MNTRRSLALTWAVVALAAACPFTAAGARPERSVCDEVGFYRGDYIGDRSKLKVVEDFHFRPHTESLLRLAGTSVDEIGADLSYTLQSFPNHHRALLALVRYGKKLKTQQPPGVDRPIECFLRRALNFRPDDTVARMVYVTYLTEQSRPADALTILDGTEAFAEDSAITYYNMGLLYADLQQWDKALRMAHRASSLGYERLELRVRLMRAGHWQDPEPRAPDPSASSAAAGASAARH